MSAPPAPAELRRLAEDLAREAGGLAAAGRRAHGPGGLAHDTKSSETDPVTEFDRAAEELLVRRLRELRPGDAIVGEEGASTSGTTGLEWQLDPIDGTVNYTYGLPAWSTSVGVRDADGGVAGAVFVPMMGELFSAARGAGASLNDTPLHVSGATELPVSLMATGFSYDRDVRRAQVRRLVAVVDATRDVRRSGSAAIDLCWVAAARVDAYFEERLNSWDVAAGELIATEAGAVVSDHDGSERRGDRILASAPGIHAAMIDLLARAPRVSPLA
jgi:myo-inositol-1(or 4)-monophosphatase